MAKRKIFSRYDTPVVEGEKNKEDSMTQQHFKQECDVNYLIKRYSETGELPLQVNGFYEDVSDLPKDLSSLQDFVSNAKQAFYTLPAEIRYRYGNNPYAVLNAVNTGELKFNSADSQATNPVVENVGDDVVEKSKKTRVKKATAPVVATPPQGTEQSSSGTNTVVE